MLFGVMGGAPGATGAAGAQGASGIPGVNSFGPPVVRTIALGNAYQASDPTKPAVVTLNINSVSSNSLLSSAQAQQKGEIIIGSTAAAVTGATGTKIGLHDNSQGGVLVVGVTITQQQGQSFPVALPIGWYFGVRQTTGANLAVTSAYDQVIG